MHCWRCRQHGVGHIIEPSLNFYFQYMPFFDAFYCIQSHWLDSRLSTMIVLAVGHQNYALLNDDELLQGVTEIGVQFVVISQVQLKPNCLHPTSSGNRVTVSVPSMLRCEMIPLLRATIALASVPDDELFSERLECVDCFSMTVEHKVQVDQSIFESLRFSTSRVRFSSCSATGTAMWWLYSFPCSIKPD